MLVSLGFGALAAWSVYAFHRREAGAGRTVLFTAVLFFGSGGFVLLLAPGLGPLWPGDEWRPIAFCAGAMAPLLAYSVERFPRLDRVYGSLDARRLLAVLLVALAAWASPASLVLLAPVLASVPRAERRGAAWWTLLGAGIALAALALVLTPAISWPTVGWPAADLRHSLDPGLLLWNLAYLLAGRDSGLGVWCLPALLLVACYRRGSGRGWLLAAVAAGALALVIASPHRWAGGGGTHLPAAFMPLYGALWLVPVRPPRVPWLVATALASGLFLWPAWLAPLATARGDDRPALHTRSLASGLLYETTLEHAPATTEWRGVGVLSRSLGPGLADTDDGPALVPRHGPAELMIASERPLEAVFLDFGPRAPSELEVRGGELGNTLFKPDGGVRFEVTVDEPDREHPMWFSAKRHSIYLLELGMPDAGAGELPVEILARPRDALPRSLDRSGSRAGAGMSER